MNPLEAQEIIISAHEPPDTGGDRAGDERGVIRVSYVWDVRWRSGYCFDEGEKLFFEQPPYFSLRQLEFWIREHSNVLIQNEG